jgi:hypothetical protein
VKNGWKSIAIAYGLPAIVLLGYWYSALTPVTIESPEFWVNMLLYLAAGAALMNVVNRTQANKVNKITGGIITVSLLLIIGGMAVGSQVLRSKDYASLISYTEGDFAKDLTVTDPAQIPTIDRDMAERLGSRKLGEMLNLVSQFDVSTEYTQIAYQGKSVRVSPLEYVNFFRWLNNRKDGIPHYVTVDMVTGESALVDLKKNIHYSHSGFFGDDITRHIFFHHPTAMFEKPVFELDEEGNPYYIASIVKRQFSFMGPKEVIGVFVVDASTGEITRYDKENVPDWVDRVFPADMLMTQINYNGQYQSGFLNSVISKKGVIQNAGGYNYIVLDNDLYLYTGMTSVASDESNIGFVLVNSRTKEAKRYNVSTATEWSAMESAQGSVQEKGYKSTFPLLFNMENKPVYLLSLKDDAGLIKLYAFVNATNYQKVGVGNSLTAAWNAYTGGVTDIATDETKEIVETKTITGTIAAMESVVIDGETTYYFTLQDDAKTIYIAKVSINKQLPFIKAGDNVTLEVDGTSVVSITKN